MLILSVNALNFRIHGEEETPETALGKQTHKELVKETVKVKQEDLWRRIFAGDFIGVREMLLAGKHHETIVLGVANLVYFYETRPTALFEHKFSKKAVPFTDHHVQAQLYCYLLQQMGFDGSRLEYLLVMAPPECKGSDELRKIPTCIFEHPKQKVLTLELPQGKTKIYINSYEREKILRDLEWALGFWKREREAKPTKKAGKCQVCPFKDNCDFSLNKPNVDSAISPPQDFHRSKPYPLNRDRNQVLVRLQDL